jgi:FAD/FMN-containing dehydrogenase
MSIAFNDTITKSWGRVVEARTCLATPSRRRDLRELVLQATGFPHGLLATGKLRSYGLSCLNPDGHAVDMTLLDKFIHFDRGSGILRAEAGLVLGDLIAVTLPHGWFPAVTPGTRFVTLGGAIANDVHGKNHHKEGTFGRHIQRIGLMRSDGNVLEISRESHADLFAATIGGMGLTGVILWAELALRRVGSAFVRAEDIPFTSIEEYLSLEAASTDWTYRVAWIDCTQSGSGIYSRAIDCNDGDYCASFAGPKFGLPMDLPGYTLNPFTLKAFNSAYNAAKTRKPGVRRTGVLPFFYPLDAIAGWNRLYGPKGFYQYQLVLPHERSVGAIQACLDVIAASGQGSFLAVLKTFGDVESPGLMSFPMPGVTLALDFANRGASTLALLAQLDVIVDEAGGRLYAAKDGRIPPDLFKQQYPRFNEFLTHVDANMSSGFWRTIQP